MGYNLYITRQQNWFDEVDDQMISMEEWIEYVHYDPSLSFETFTKDKIVQMNEPDSNNTGVAIWTNYSKNGRNNNYAWIYYVEGNIECKNPDTEIIGKMIGIASQLHAEVQCDKGEEYRSLDDKIVSTANKRKREKNRSQKKTWWKFW